MCIQSQKNSAGLESSQFWIPFSDVNHNQMKAFLIETNSSQKGQGLGYIAGEAKLPAFLLVLQHETERCQIIASFLVGNSWRFWATTRFNLMRCFRRRYPLKVSSGFRSS